MLIAAVIIAASVSSIAGDLVFDVCQGYYSGTKLPYRKAISNGDGNGKYALVIYLHGGSSKGNDNNKQLAEKASTPLPTTSCDITKRRFLLSRNALPTNHGADRC